MAVSAVFGTFLMLMLTITMVPVVVQLFTAQRDAMNAEREAAEHAAYCARNPDGYRCEDYDVVPGYECSPQNGNNSTLVCYRNSTG
ncbi:MAG TPA: hypothetical protein VNZ52_13005 [Candidatus Thermoplasmatota archaeon]|nr:hypothetical protein [Candidatus Thermoplasmatota archaeon]